MPPSNLGKLLSLLIQQLAQQPELLTNRLPPSINNLTKVIKFLPGAKNFDIPHLLMQANDVIEKMPNEFWIHLEDMLIDIIDGEEGATDRVLQWVTTP